MNGYESTVNLALLLSRGDYYSSERFINSIETESGAYFETMFRKPFTFVTSSLFAACSGSPNHHKTQTEHI